MHIIDHASREELLSKYERHEVAHDQIEEVDFVWRGESYVELTGRPGQYDWMIGSHLVEHMPDLIGFLADCDALLDDGGVLSLVIPDKRYIFDRFRPITGLARVIDAHEAVVDKICSGDAMGAVTAMSYHFDISIVHVTRRESAVADEEQPRAAAG